MTKQTVYIVLIKSTNFILNFFTENRMDWQYVDVPPHKEKMLQFWYRNVESSGKVSECCRCLHRCMKSMLRCQHRVLWKLGHTLGCFSVFWDCVTPLLRLPLPLCWLHCWLPLTQRQSTGMQLCKIYQLIDCSLKGNSNEKNHHPSGLKCSNHVWKVFLYILQLLFLLAWKAFNKKKMCFVFPRPFLKDERRHAGLWWTPQTSKKLQIRTIFFN